MMLVVCCGVIAGCGANPDQTPVVATTGVPDATLALSKAIASVDRAMNQFDPAQAWENGPTAPSPYVPVELRRPMDVNLANVSIDQAAGMLAGAAGYKFAVINPSKHPPLVVSLSGARTPIIDLLRSLGAQAGTKAVVTVNGDTRSVEVAYRDA
jgi:defect-in-organelle-trafficking protein DotD